MKIQAKDLKKGMTVKYVNVWVLVNAVKDIKFKNGKEAIQVTGTQLEGVIRREGFKIKVQKLENFSVTFRATTKVSIK